MGGFLLFRVGTDSSWSASDQKHRTQHTVWQFQSMKALTITLTKCGGVVVANGRSRPAEFESLLWHSTRYLLLRADRVPVSAGDMAETSPLSGQVAGRTVQSHTIYEFPWCRDDCGTANKMWPTNVTALYRFNWTICCIQVTRNEQASDHLCQMLLASD